jgi:hypothetical protein
MRYKKSERVQSETYSSVEELILDAIEAIKDEDNYERSVSIIANRDIIEYVAEYIEQSELDFKFDIVVADFRDNVDEYIIDIIDTGEVWIEPVKVNNSYCELSGFMYVHKNIDLEAYNGENRRNDVIVFSLNDF